ncbi:MAG: hypothetical protein LC769_08175 [Chloroflexi bacterium]|nr:hypothetical protein [Chloroflexota bacterium]
MSLHIARRALAPALVAATFTGALAPALSSHGHAAARPGVAGHATMSAITLYASTFAFPKSVPAGMVKVTVVNDTTSEVEAGFGRANQGITKQQLVSIINDQSEQGFIRALHAITFVGGASSVLAGQRETVTFNLTPGQYGVVNSDGKKPVYHLFTVTANGGQAATSEPMTTVAVQLKDFKFAQFPQHLNAGMTTFKLTNPSPMAHEMALIKLLQGKTIDDVKKALSNPGPPPAWALTEGGMDSMSPQTTGWLTLNLTPGRYVAVCFMPDTTKHGEPHAAEGMITAFSVS